MRNNKTYILLSFSFLLLATSCKHSKVENNVGTPIDLKSIVSSDTLRVATMYGATSYFLYRDELMGFDYEMAEDLSKYLHINLKISVAKTEAELFRWLAERKVDVVSYNVIETKELKKRFNFVHPQSNSYQVLVQNMGANALSDVTEMEGESVYVKENSIFHQRLKALNEEIGGSINIVLAADTLSDDDLIDMVAEKKIKFTLGYHNVGLLHKSYSRKLDVHMPVGFEQRNGWLIRKESHNLKKAIETWEKLDNTVQIQTDLVEKYWRKSPFFVLRKVNIPKGAISPFDNLFRKYSPDISWDWRLIAAVAFQESGFDSQERSWAGAAGLMQLMPHTARSFGLNSRTILNPEMNIEAAVQYIKSLNMSFRQIVDGEERKKFILAAYNSGPSHVLDAVALAEKLGKNPAIWFDNVEYCLTKLSEPEFYNDPVVKYGIFKSNETVNYVKSTLDTYEKYKNK